MHPRHMGIATNTSFFLGKPIIGVAKNYYHIEGAEFVLPDNYEGAYTEIVRNGEIYGQVLRTHQDVKPIFISCGNWIDIETSQKFVLEFVTKESRLPVTTRYADILTDKERKRLSGICK
ncbi:endonuclease V [Streptococcus gordonii]|uniref:endonuclease V n=1 Tax=Streptococcus gordonii TaxID=1302 RepID=UPI002493EC11|nr:endonuclease V [Streptococcus gordonii]